MEDAEDLIVAVIAALSPHNVTQNERLEAIEHALHHIRNSIEELKTMSQTLSQQLDAATAAIQADVAAVAAEVTQLLAGVTTGSTITQAQVDALTAIDTALKAIPAAVGSTHTPEDTTDTTPNGSARADGSVRNNFFLPNFNSANPETT